MQIVKIFAAFGAIALVSAARADLTIVQEVKGGPSSGEMTVNVKGDKARVDASPQMAMIIDSKSGEMTTLMNDQKKFMRVSGDTMRAMGGNSQHSPAPGGKLTPTQNHESINGYETTEYTFETPQYKASYWIATNYPDGPAIMAEMQRLSNQAWGPASGAMPNYKDFPGIPLRTRLTIGKAEIVSTIKSITRDTLPDSLFTPPKDFTEMKMGDIGKALGGKPAAAPKTSASPAKP